MLRGLDKLENTTQSITGKFSDALRKLDPEPPPHDDMEESPVLRILRPPGALEGDAFNQTCSRCGKCVEVCPAQAIKITQGIADGLPHIIARESPCVVCSDLSCMKSCPSGALQLLDTGADIAMGVAVMDFAKCLRTSGVDGTPGEDCRVCINDCPIGQSALGIDGYGRVQVRPGCTGCGVCERACPTEPASIWVQPRGNL